MPTTTIPPAPRWDLDSVFEGGSQSPAYFEHLKQVKSAVKDARKKVASLVSPIDAGNVSGWAEFVLNLQDLTDNLDLAGSFAECLISQNVDDTVAMGHEAECDLLRSELRKLQAELEAKSLEQTDDQWALLLKQPGVDRIAFFLKELRSNARDKMPLAQESLALDLGVNGYEAWQRLYDKMAGDIRVDFETDGKAESVSMGQIATKMSDRDRDVRARAFEGLTAGWSRRENLAAIALNSLAGFRWTLYDHRGWTNPVHESLLMNRIKQETVDAMWNVIRRESPRLKAYVETKKRLLGIDRFTWYDQLAPVGQADPAMSFQEAGEFVVDQARDFSPPMADFMEQALERRWVEAEDRGGKRGGAFCTGFGPRKQSRVFMTFGGTFDSMLTLAHELGHAYHSHILRDTPAFAADYPMGLAETASIFAETLVLDAAYRRESDTQTRLMLIDQKLQGALGLFCDLHCRYLFEKEYYAERRSGVLSVARLKELMVSAQERAFAGMLDETGYHPLFWASKLHFYIANQPFYNWPYTFGYLFAGGVYDRAKQEGPAFADKYAALLADTGNMTTEEVAMRHLGVDLSKEDFWVDAVNRSLADVDEFVKLAG